MLDLVRRVGRLASPLERDDARVSMRVMGSPVVASAGRGVSARAIGRKDGSMATPSVGEPCPRFDLPDADGVRVSSDSLRGQPYVLYFYPKDDTSGCTLEAIEFTALDREFAALGVPVFGVSPDDGRQHCKFRDKHGLKVRLLSDVDKTLLQDFGVWVEKSMYGRTYMGVERTTALVDAEGRIAHLWPKVKANGHAAEVLDVSRRHLGHDG
jgi:thioredoxin-dependent peroxiredoxin